jgi:hypothetical protein
VITRDLSAIFHFSGVIVFESNYWVEGKQKDNNSLVFSAMIW